MAINLKEQCSTILSGFLFGIGFTISAWVIYFAYSYFQNQETYPIHGSSESTYIDSNQKLNDKQFTFINVEEVKRNNRSYFIGQVKNNNASAVNGISIEINLFNKKKFVDQYSTYISGSIQAGQTKYFKISCGCKDEVPAEYDEYKIQVVE